MAALTMTKLADQMTTVVRIPISASRRARADTRGRLEHGDARRSGGRRVE